MKEVETKSPETTEPKPEVKEAVKSESKPFSISDLIGQTKAAATEAAKKAGYITHVESEDGKGGMKDMMINNKRVNFTITKGLITGAKLG